MSELSRRTLALLAALGLCLPLGTPAFAAAPADYSIRVQGETLRIMDGAKTRRTYKLENTEIRVMRSTRDNLLVGIVKEGDDKVTNVTVGAQDSLTITGSMTDLVLAPSLPADWEITLDGKAGTMTVETAAAAVLEDGASVGSLKITNPKANVSAVTGATVKKTSAVTGAKLKNIQKNTTLTEEKAQNVSKATKVPTYVDFEERDEIKYTRDIGYGDNEITVEARSGYSVGSTVRDIRFTVRRNDDSDSRITGKWAFVPSSAASSTKDGTYTYRFTPSNTDLYGTIDVDVVYTGSGDKRGLSKPGLDFEDRSHGDGDFEIEVTYPTTVEDDDVLLIVITDEDGEKTEERHDLSRSDAGETDSYSLSVSGASEAQFKIKVKIEREHGSDSSYSKSITYEID